MAKSLNKVMIIGNLGQEPEIKHFEGDVTLARFSVATNESYKRKDGEFVERTEWHNVVAWRGLATIIEKYVNKGDQIFVEGKIRSRSYEDENKEMRKITEIEALNIVMMGSRGSGGGASSDNSSTQSAPLPKKEKEQPAGNTANEPPEEDDLPF